MNKDIKLKIVDPQPPLSITFHKDNTLLGTLSMESGKLTFKGDIARSGEKFIEWINKNWGG